MIIFTTPNSMNFCIREKTPKVFMNFTSSLEGSFKKLYGLNPYYFYDNIPYSDISFDDWYKVFIESNKEALKELIEIMMLAYNGVDVIILIDGTMSVCTALEDSLIKYIQFMYGYTCNLVHSPEDAEYLKDGTFSSSGIELVDSQIDYYINLYGSKEPMYNRQNTINSGDYCGLV